MKTNKNKLSAVEVFTRDIQSAFARHYSQTLSENIKRGIAKKKLLMAQKVNK